MIHEFHTARISIVASVVCENRKKKEVVNFEFGQKTKKEDETKNEEKEEKKEEERRKGRRKKKRKKDVFCFIALKL